MNASGTATARYTQGLGIDEPLEVYEGNASYYYHADGLGSIVALTKSNGSAVNTYFGYNTFGGMPAPSETVANPFRFTGREWDSETGLYYYSARYYDPLFGRFISEDPIRFGGGANFYPYVGNHPVNYSDPSGLERQRIGPPTATYNCLAWGLGLNSVWVQPVDGASPNSVFPKFGCKKINCKKDVDCNDRAKVKVFEDSKDPHNWHVERQTCDKGWTSKYGANALYDHIDDPDADYTDVYKPGGKTKTKCWSCPVVPPTDLPKSRKIQYLQR